MVNSVTKPRNLRLEAGFQNTHQNPCCQASIPARMPTFRASWINFIVYMPEPRQSRFADLGAQEGDWRIARALLPLARAGKVDLRKPLLGQTACLPVANAVSSAQDFNDA